MRAIIAIAVLSVIGIGGASAQQVADESPYKKAFDAAFARCGGNLSCRSKVINIGIGREHARHELNMRDVDAITLSLQHQAETWRGKTVEPERAALPKKTWDANDKYREQIDVLLIDKLESTNP